NKAKDFAQSMFTEIVAENATTAYQDISSYIHGLDEAMGNPDAVDVPDWAPAWVKESNGVAKEMWLRAQRQVATTLQTAVGTALQRGTIATIDQAASAKKKLKEREVGKKA